MINFGILGAGKIAQSMAKAGAYLNDDIALYSIGARDTQRAKEFAEKFGFEKSFGSYEEFLSDENLQLVYVSTPTGCHYEHAKLCLEHGKHVLCEKSFTVTADEAKELYDLAKEKGLFIMEAMWTRFLPFLKKLKEIIASKELGEILEMKSSFCLPMKNNERVNTKELGGGALLDLGVYGLTISRLIFGTDIEKIQTNAVVDHEVDIDNKTTLYFKNGKKAYFESAINRMSRLSATIFFEKGKIVIPLFWFATKFKVKKQGKLPKTYKFPHPVNGYEFELKSAVDCINKNILTSDVITPDESIEIVRIMQNLRKEWGLDY